MTGVRVSIKPFCMYLKCNTLFVAIDDFDVSGFPMTGTIDENNSQQCFSISITDDKNREGTETFTVRFDVTNSQGNLIYNPISATVSILDDDSKCRVHKLTKLMSINVDRNALVLHVYM